MGAERKSEPKDRSRRLKNQSNVLRDANMLRKAEGNCRVRRLIFVNISDPFPYSALSCVGGIMKTLQGSVYSAQS